MPTEWETFYFMMGSAAAGLIGLLFVVVTLSGEIDATKASRRLSMRLRTRSNVLTPGRSSN